MQPGRPAEVELVDSQFSITPGAAFAVVASTVAMYAAYILLVRLTGQRSLSPMSSFDFACVVAIGAVLGRTVLLEATTLPGGVIALVTFFVLQGLLGMASHHPRLDRLLNPAPVLLMAGDRLLTDTMQRVHVTEDEVRLALRQVGVRRLEEVSCVVLERNGSVSVLTTQTQLDPWLVREVKGAEELLETQEGSS